MLSQNLLMLLGLAAGLSEGREVPQRPDIQPTPYHPYKAIPLDSTRDGRVCHVKPSCTKGRDDAAKIIKAFEECNDGGTIVLDKEYTVCTPLDLRFLKHVDVALTGKIEFCTDLEMWQANFFQFHFQDAASWWVWGGEDIHLYGLGEGIIHGNGQPWWDGHKADVTVHRPLLFITDGWHGGSITGLNMRQSPNVSASLGRRISSDFG